MSQQMRQAVSIHVVVMEIAQEVFARVALVGQGPSVQPRSPARRTVTHLQEPVNKGPACVQLVSSGLHVGT